MSELAKSRYKCGDRVLIKGYDCVFLLNKEYNDRVWISFAEVNLKPDARLYLIDLHYTQLYDLDSSFKGSYEKDIHPDEIIGYAPKRICPICKKI